MANSSVKANALGDLKLLNDVIRFKQQFYLCPWAKYDEAVPGSFHLRPPEKLNKQLKSDYNNMQAMIFGTPPTWEEIINSLGDLESEIHSLSTP